MTGIATSWSLLKFDTGAIGHVSSARLRLFGARTSKGGSDAWITVLPASDTSWEEDKRTWNLQARNALDSVNLANDRTERWYEWDVSDWVVREKAAGRDFVTLVLSSENGAVALFHSREARNNQPQLVLVP